MVHLRVIHRHKAVGSIWGENMRTFLGIPGAFRARHPRNEGQVGGESGTIPRESTWVCSKRGRGRERGQKAAWSSRDFLGTGRDFETPSGSIRALAGQIRGAKEKRKEKTRPRRL